MQLIGRREEGGGNFKHGRVLARASDQASATKLLDNVVLRI